MTDRCQDSIFPPGDAWWHGGTVAPCHRATVPPCSVQCVGHNRDLGAGIGGCEQISPEGRGLYKAGTDDRTDGGSHSIPRLESGVRELRGEGGA